VDGRGDEGIKDRGDEGEELSYIASIHEIT
jgi:hypothetical protein